jgi:hypothetical protein
MARKDCFDHGLIKNGIVPISGPHASAVYTSHDTAEAPGSDDEISEWYPLIMASQSDFSLAAFIGFAPNFADLHVKPN